MKASFETPSLFSSLVNTLEETCLGGCGDQGDEED